eukprot:g6867.t1
MNTSSSRLLAACCGNIVKVWDPLGSTSQSRETFFSDSQPVEFVVWSPSGDFLAYAGESRVIALKRWIERKESILQPESTRWSPIRSLRFAADGLSLISGSQDGTVTIWNSTNERQMAVVKETACQITSIATSKTSSCNAWSLAFANSSGDVSIYQVENQVPSRIGKISDTTLCSKTCSVFSPFVPGGQLFLAAGNKRGQITVWDALTRYSYFAKTVHKEALSEICFPGRCDQLLTSSLDGNVCSIDLRTSKVNAVPLGGPVCSMSLHPDNRMLAFGNKGGEICIKDQRKMNQSILTGFVHPDSIKQTVSSLMWQPYPNDQLNQTELDSTTGLPFSPVRTERSYRPHRMPQSSPSVDSGDGLVHKGSSKGASLSAAPAFCGTTSTEDDDSVKEQRLSTIHEQSNGKRVPFVFRTPARHKTAEVDGTARVRLDVKSVDRPARMTTLPTPNTTPCKPSSRVATPSRRKTRSLQKKAGKGRLLCNDQAECCDLDGVLCSDRKRPRRSGSFSDFVTCESTTPGAHQLYYNFLLVRQNPIYPQMNRKSLVEKTKQVQTTGSISTW